MDGLNNAAEARRRLVNSADGLASVAAWLQVHRPTNTDAMNDVEYLTQAERIIRRVAGFGSLKGEN